MVLTLILLRLLLYQAQDNIIWVKGLCQLKVVWEQAKEVLRQKKELVEVLIKAIKKSQVQGSIP